MTWQYLDKPFLVDYAGGDPWRVNDTVQSGRPDVVAALAQAFHDTGSHNESSEAEFAQARERFKDAWNRDDGDNPIDDSIEVQRAKDSLHLQGDQLAAVGADLEGIAAALAEAQKSAAAVIHGADGTDRTDGLEKQLQDIDDQIVVLMHDEDVDMSVVKGLFEEAGEDTATALHQVERIRDAYSETLQAGVRSLREHGYDDPVIQPYDDDPLQQIVNDYQVADDPGGALENWTPGWLQRAGSIDREHPFGKGELVSASEAQIIGTLSLAQQWDFRQIRQAAEAEAQKRFPGVGITDTQLDAFRHAYWNALMTRQFGEEWTRNYATAHEALPDNNPYSEAMDLYNNQLGRQIASANPNVSSQQLADLIQQSVTNGNAVVIRPDGQGLAWSNEVPLGQTGHATGMTDVPPLPGSQPFPATGTRPGGGYQLGHP